MHVYCIYIGMKAELHTSFKKIKEKTCENTRAPSHFIAEMLLYFWECENFRISFLYPFKQRIYYAFYFHFPDTCHQFLFSLLFYFLSRFVGWFSIFYFLFFGFFSCFCISLMCWWPLACGFPINYVCLSI